MLPYKMRWHKITVKFGGVPATHTTFYRRYEHQAWVSHILQDLSREFNGATHIHIHPGMME